MRSAQVRLQVLDGRPLICQKKFHTVCLGGSQPEHLQVAVSVFNDGNNIKEEELNKIWQGFYQTDERVKESNVGLGLYIVRNIVKNHNGVCYAKNHHNGVEFVMEFNRTDKY